MKTSVLLFALLISARAYSASSDCPSLSGVFAQCQMRNVSGGMASVPDDQFAFTVHDSKITLVMSSAYGLDSTLTMIPDGVARSLNDGTTATASCSQQALTVTITDAEIGVIEETQYTRNGNTLTITSPKDARELEICQLSQ
jgi:hypothetical protein